MEFCLFSDGWTTADLVFIWKEGDPVQVVKNLHLPRFTLEKFLTDYCNSKTNTGNYIFISSIFYLPRMRLVNVSLLVKRFMCLLARTEFYFWYPLAIDGVFRSAKGVSSHKSVYQRYALNSFPPRSNCFTVRLSTSDITICEPVQCTSW